MSLRTVVPKNSLYKNMKKGDGGKGRPHQEQHFSFF